MNLYHRLFSESWAITEAGAIAFSQVFRYEVPSQPRAETDFFGNTIPEVWYVNDLAIVPVCGPLIKGAGFLEKGFGATGHDDIAADLDEAVERGAQNIVLNVSSPGGTVRGTQELATKIAQINQTVPVYAYTETLMASAAYWLCAGASGIFATNTSESGCIGTMLQFSSFARALTDAGVDTQIFTSAGTTVKAAGSPFKSMTAEEQEYLQTSVDTCGQMFANFVDQQRPQIDPAAYNGGVFYGKKALALGLIDGVADNLNMVVDGIATGSISAQATIKNKGPREKKLNFKPAKNPNPVNPPPPKKNSSMDYYRRYAASGHAVIATRRNVISSADYSPEQLRKFKKLC